MIIYADTVFIENFAGAYALLYILGKTLHLKMRPLKLFFGACLGAAAALVQFIYGIRLTAVSIIFMYFTAYGIKTKGLLQNIVVFSVIQITSGFISAAICSIFADGIIKNGIAYFPADTKIFIISLCTAYPLTLVIMRIKNIKEKKRLHRLRIIKNKKYVDITAIFDSGNMLTEPISGLGVIVADKCVAKELNINEAVNAGIRIIPYKTISGSGVMTAFLADEVIIDNQAPQKFYIGISPVKLSSSDEYSALIGYK